MARETCWRCGKAGQLNNANCEGCGVENPGMEPSRSIPRATGISNDDSAWEAFRSREAATPSGWTSAWKSNSVAKRLQAESSIAITAIYVSAWIASGLIAIAVLIVILSPGGDGWSKFLGVVGGVVVVAAVWISTMLILPFYSYMNMRAVEALQARD